MSILASLQQQISDRIQADPMFAYVPVFTERIKELQSEINLALGPLNGCAGKSGLVVVVLTPTANASFGEVFGPFFDDIRITVKVLENVTQNQDSLTGTGIPAVAAAEQICGLLHQFMPEGAGGPVLVRKPAITLANDPLNLVYQCHFRTSGGLRNVPPKLASPGCTQQNGLLTMSCATAGAAIFYTLDGSLPLPRNPMAFLYTAPVTSVPGATLKARAFLAGYLNSEIAMATL